MLHITMHHWKSEKRIPEEEEAKNFVKSIYISVFHEIFVKYSNVTIFCCWRKKNPKTLLWVDWNTCIYVTFFVNCVRKNNCGTNGDPECVSCQIFFWKQVLSKYYFILLTYYYYNYYITTHFFDSVNEKRTDLVDDKCHQHPILWA